METNLESVAVIFPNQLFKSSTLLDNSKEIFLIEELLYFKYFNFHKQKIAFHRSSMQKYKNYLSSKNIKVHYVESFEKNSDIRLFLSSLNKSGCKKINIYNPIDDWLFKRISNFKENIKLKVFQNPLFINDDSDLDKFFRADKNKFSHSVFYKQQRKKFSILMDIDNKPIGGKFSFDSENRKKYPTKKIPPHIDHPSNDRFWLEAVEYTNKYYYNNHGEISSKQYYPNDYSQSDRWFDQFLIERFKEFGDYEDAIVNNQVFLNHSILTPMLNTGLISPYYVVEKTLDYAKTNNVPINSVEGFIRQIIGWREFIRGMYTCKGSFSRNHNYWRFDRKIPESFYSGQTGVDPIDDSIKKIIKYGYCHHIERLMILGNFMLLCEFNPNEVYKWFMELFIDSYDWVMVPNVYGMSQFADGGTFATKPYISSSNYIIKMSNYRRGNWSEVWDGLYWNFIKNNSEFFKSNPRLSMMLNIFNKMKPEVQNKHIKLAKRYISSLS